MVYVVEPLRSGYAYGARLESFVPYTGHHRRINRAKGPGWVRPTINHHRPALWHPGRLSQGLSGTALYTCALSMTQHEAPTTVSPTSHTLSGYQHAHGLSQMQRFNCSPLLPPTFCVSPHPSEATACVQQHISGGKTTHLEERPSSPPHEGHRATARGATAQPTARAAHTPTNADEVWQIVYPIHAYMCVRVFYIRH
jgi:hypothetical protein